MNGVFQLMCCTCICFVAVIRKGCEAVLYESNEAIIVVFGIWLLKKEVLVAKSRTVIGGILGCIRSNGANSSRGDTQKKSITKAAISLSILDGALRASGYDYSHLVCKSLILHKNYMFSLFNYTFSLCKMT